MNKYPIDKDFKILTSFKSPLNFFGIFLSRVFWWVVPKGKKNPLVKTTKVKMTNPTDGGKFTLLMMERKLPTKNAKNDKETNLHQNSPCLVYFHGGAFVFGPIWAHYDNARDFVAQTGVKVALVRYRLAPKHKYPSGVNDCVYTYKYIYDNAQSFNIDKERLAIGGDSAGGFMAIQTAKYALKQLDSRPKLLMLVYPVMTDDMDTLSMQKYVDTPVWNAKLNKKMWKLFADGKKVDCANEWEGFKDIPYIYVETAEFDCLRDEGERFARRFADFNDCEVICNTTKGTVHGYDVIAKSVKTKDSIDKRVEILKRSLG